MRILSQVLASLIILSVFLTACNRNDGPRRTKSAALESKPAPDITVTALDGTATTLSALKGQVVMVNFWATWCPPCREEIPSLVNLANIMKGKPFQILAISIDEGGRDAVNAFIKGNGMNLPVYLDADRSASAAYGITGVPETFIVDRNGILVKKVIGPLMWDSPDVVSYIGNLMK